MKLAKSILLLLIGWGLPLLAAAQQQVPKTTDAKAPSTDILETLRNSVNPHYKVLKDITPIYHQPADTATGRFASKLSPGTKVYIRDWVPGGFMIDLGLGGRYFLPAKSVKGLPTFVEI